MNANWLVYCRKAGREAMRMVTSSYFTPSLVKLFEPVHTTDAPRLVPTTPETASILKWLYREAWMPPCLEKIVRRTDIRDPVP